MTNHLTRQPRGARRREIGSAQSPIDWLPSIEEILDDDTETEAFRLAVLLINKQLKEDWNDEYKKVEDQLGKVVLKTEWILLGLN